MKLILKEDERLEVFHRDDSSVSVVLIAKNSIIMNITGHDRYREED